MDTVKYLIQDILIYVIFKRSDWILYVVHFFIKKNKKI